MAIVDCPRCKKPVSSKARSCGSCGATLDPANHERDARLAARARREQARRMASQAVLATLLGVSGGLWLIFGQLPRQDEGARTLALIMLAGGLIWYVLVRVRLWLHRHR